MSELPQHMEAVARHLLGEPNKKLSGKRELRFGSRGSIAVDLDKGVWHDHETGTGGGVLDLIQRETGLRNGAALAWLHDELHIEIERKEAKGPRRIVAAYDYTDEVGALLFQVVRYQPKEFRQRRPDGKGDWLWSLGDVRRTLYRLPDLAAADPAAPVFVTEGEKDVDRLRGLGLVATTSPQGAGKWTKCDRAALAGRHVVVLPDNDQPGRQHAQEIAHDLAGKAASVRVLELPGLPPKGDVSDWLDRGGTADELRRLAAEAPDATPEPAVADWRDHLLCSERGQPLALEANVVTLLSHAPELRGRLRWNELARTVECRAMPWDRGPPAWRSWEDVDDAQLCIYAQRQGLRVRPAICAAAVQVAGHEACVHPVRDYLDRLVWDGTPRLASWLGTYLGANGEDDGQRVYLREVGRCSLISAVARVYRPGCKVDTVPVLNGGQGVGKSSALEALVPDPAWYADELADLGTVDAAQGLAGKWIVELSELSAMRRSEIERVKAFLSRSTDHYRPSYGRRAIDAPRQCILFGTTNADVYLADVTGGRRFWPVQVGAIDLDALRRDRDQLWAEAVAAFKAGERWHLDRNVEALARAEQEDRREVDPWETLAAQWLADRDSVTTEDLLQHGLGVPRERLDRAAQTRAGHVLKALGWVAKRPRGSAKRERRYFRPDAGGWTTSDEVGPQEATKPSKSKGGPTGPTGPTYLEDSSDTRYNRTVFSQKDSESRWSSRTSWTGWTTCACGKPADAPNGLCAACYWQRHGSNRDDRDGQP